MAVLLFTAVLVGVLGFFLLVGLAIELGLKRRELKRARAEETKTAEDRPLVSAPPAPNQDLKFDSSLVESMEWMPKWIVNGVGSNAWVAEVKGKDGALHYLRRETRIPQWLQRDQEKYGHFHLDVVRYSTVHYFLDTFARATHFASIEEIDRVHAKLVAELTIRRNHQDFQEAKSNWRIVE